MMQLKTYLLLAILLVGCASPLQATPSGGSTFYVATNGNDGTGDGSEGAPWATLNHAIVTVPDGSTILVQPGTYFERVRLREQFVQGVVIKSAVPYQAKLRYNGTVVLSYYGQNITLEGFDIAHTEDNVNALVIQIQDLLGDIAGAGDGSDPVVENIILRDNIIHDSTNNDLLKINNGAQNISVIGNMFFNQSGSDEHIDINSVRNVTVEDNIFFNSFASNSDTSAYIVIKDSNADDDSLLGAQDIQIRRNIFLNWHGSSGSNFVLLGEDGQNFYEAFDVTIENNLLIGNSEHLMRAPFGVKGGRDIIFRHNTIVGDLPSRSFVTRLNTEGSNPNNNNIQFYNNVWADPTGTMGAEWGSTILLFEVPPEQNDTVTLDNNLFWNGGQPLPVDQGQLLTYQDDANRVSGNPQLGDQAGLVVPVWDGTTFADGSGSVRQAFLALVNNYGTPSAQSAVVDAGNPDYRPIDDILGRPRGVVPDLGAVELPEEVTLIWLPVMVR